MPTAAVVDNSKTRLAGFPSILQEPAAFLQRGGHKFLYGCKQGLYFVASLTDTPRLAALVKKITECVGPALAHWGNYMSTWAEASKHFVGMVEAFDLLELIGDANYFFNGGYLKDRAKKHYNAVAAHIALVPANIIGTCLFVRDVFSVSFSAVGSFAAAVGRIRVFGFVPKLAGLVQTWPVFRSIPDLAGKTAWVGNLQVFGFVSRVSILTVLRSVVAVAHAYFMADAIKRFITSGKKVEKYGQAFDKKIDVKPSDKNLKKIFDKAGVVDQAEKEELAKHFVKYRAKLIKRKQALLDGFASGSEVAIKVAVIGGLTAGATVAGSVALGLLGAISLLCIGSAAYHKFSVKKPDVKDVI